MAQEITKELVQELLKIPGEARGMHFTNDAQYVVKKAGKEGLKKVEEELEKMGCPIKYEKVNSLDFYPVGLRAVSLLVIQKALGWGEKEIKDSCGFAVGVSLIAKLYMRFFYSPERMVREAPEMWRKYFTYGELSVLDYNEGKKYVILEIKNFKLHPIYCRCLDGYLGSIVKMIVNAKETQCQETQCVFSGQKSHQFKITWK